MSQEQAKVLTDQTTNPNAHVVREIDLSEAWGNVAKLRGELESVQDGGTTVLAKLADACAPIAASYMSGGFLIRHKPREDGKEPTAEDIEKIEIKPELPSDDLAKRLSREVLEKLGFNKPEKLVEGDALKSRVSYNPDTVKATVKLAAKAAILVATNADGFTVWPFSGNSPLAHPDTAKTTEERAKLEKAWAKGKRRLAAVWNKVEPNFSLGKKGFNANGQETLIPASPNQVKITWAAHVEGKQRDATGKLARGVKDTATNSGAEGFTIPSDADPVQVINALTRYLEKVKADPTGKLVASLSAMEDTLSNMAGLADEVYTAVFNYNADYGQKEAA